MTTNSQPRDPRNTSRQAEEAHLAQTLAVIQANLESYGRQVGQMQADIDEMLEHYHDNDAEVYTILVNTITLHDHIKRALLRNEKAKGKPYFGRIDFHDEKLDTDETLYIGRGGISRDSTHQEVIDWRAPVANAYYENGLGKCSYPSPDTDPNGDGEGKKITIDLKLKRTYEIENGKLLDFFDSEVIANDDLLTKYLAKNKQAVLSEIVATIQKEQNEIIRKSPYHNVIVQGVAGSGKTTVAMHRISYILYNYAERFRPEDFYIVGSNRILLNYITGVLPDLDVYGVRQMTMEQLFVRLLYEDWDEKKYRIKGISQSDSRGSVKGGTRWFEDLKSYCDEIEWNSILRDSIYLNPRQFVEGIRNGKAGVYDETEGHKTGPEDLILLVDGSAVERYILQNPKISVQSKINMLNERLSNKVKEVFWGKGISYTEAERKAILKAYRGRYGGRVWKTSIYKLYREFLSRQILKGDRVDIPGTEFDVYDLAALAYLYKRIKETEVISEAHHVVIDEAQDFGMMAYRVLHFCIQACTYTVMGDVSQNIHFGFGLNDWEELRRLLLAPDEMASFGVLKKSYRNTVEISDFATNILHHGQFSSYPVEPIIRHGEPVRVQFVKEEDHLPEEAAAVCREWQKKGLETIAIICRNAQAARHAAEELGKYVEVMESDLEKAEFGAGILVLPVEYTKGLEFDAVLILDPDRTDYPSDDGHAKLLYVAATRALHELCVLYHGDLTGLIADPLPQAGKGKRADGFENAPERMAKPQEAARDKTTAEARGEMGPSGRRKPSIKISSAIRQNPGPKVVINPPERSAVPNRIPPKGRTSCAKPAMDERSPISLPAFGDLPPTQLLRPSGHSRADLSIRWTAKQKDGLYLQSRYGTLRLSPIGSSILRVTFSRGNQIKEGVHPRIGVDRIEKYWMYKDAGDAITISTDEMLIQVSKSSGSIRYMTRDKKSLLSENVRECRLIETFSTGVSRTRIYLDWAKGEQLYAIGPGGRPNLSLRGTAKYLSDPDGELPFLISDKGYGLLLATDQPVFCCDIPAYGSHLCLENTPQADFYFLTGRTQDSLGKARDYLLGK